MSGCTVTENEYTAFAGDTLRIEVTVLDEAGEPLELTGASLVYVLVDTSGTEVLRKTSDDEEITINDNMVIIAIEAGDTSALGGERIYHELQLTDAGGNVSTLVAGWVTFEATEIAS